MAWTADDLVAAVRVRAQMPDAAGDGAITDADILTLANEEIALRLVPLVRRSRGDYFVATHDVTIVSGTGAYRVPSRAQTSGLRELTIVDSSGREWPVPQMHLEDAGPAQTVGGGYGSVRFYMRGPDVVLVPTPTYSDCTLRMYYHRSHSTLVANAQSASALALISATDIYVPKVATNDPNGNALLVRPAAWVADYTMDIVWAGPPFGPVQIDTVISSVDTADPNVDAYTMSLPVPQIMLDLQTWSFVMSVQGTTSVVDLPRECWPLLVSAVTARVCEVIGDRDAAAMAFGLYDREQANIMTLMTPRVEGNKQVIVDRFSTLRSGRGGGWGWR